MYGFRSLFPLLFRSWVPILFRFSFVRLCLFLGSFRFVGSPFPYTAVPRFVSFRLVCSSVSVIGLSLEGAVSVFGSSWEGALHRIWLVVGGSLSGGRWYSSSSRVFRCRLFLPSSLFVRFRQFPWPYISCFLCQRRTFWVCFRVYFVVVGTLQFCMRDIPVSGPVFRVS